jgi:hypothetical protein
MYTLLSKRTKQLGISIPEYLRFLVINDTKPLIDNIPMIDLETENEIGKALKNYKAGRYKTLRNEKEIDEYFKNLDNEE